MSSKEPKQPKPRNHQNQQQQQNQQQPITTTSTTNNKGLQAMVEFKQRILTFLSKLSDRDTHHIALEEITTIIQTLSPETISLLLNTFHDSLSDPSVKPIVKKETLHLISLTCATHRDSAQPHLVKIVSNVIKRLKDSDSGVREGCRDAVGVLSGLYLRNEGNVALFARPLFEALGEQNKGVQSGAAMCLAKMVECACGSSEGGVDLSSSSSSSTVPIGAFQKMCPRICKLMNVQSFQAKAALLGVISSLSQAGAIAPQSMEPLLQSIHDCLNNTDWATRKAASDALCAIASHSSGLITDAAANSTLTALEATRFDKIKPVRDSMAEALQLWKKIASKGGKSLDVQKPASHHGDQTENTELLDKNASPGDGNTGTITNESSNGSSLTNASATKSKGLSIPEKAVVILKKKTPVLSDKELNPEFFQKFERRGSGDFPVEVVVPRRKLNNGEETEPTDSESRERSIRGDDIHGSLSNKNRNGDGKGYRTRGFDGEDKIDANPKNRSDGQHEAPSTNNKGNWLAIQRQLLQLERQQNHLMTMLQDFMGGSHDSVVTLENRVRGLERVVEDMVRDLSVSSARRGNNFSMAFDGSSNRSIGKYSGFSEYSSTKFNGRAPLGERFGQSDFTASGIRGKTPHWRSDMADAFDFPSRTGQGSRRTQGAHDVCSPKSDDESEQVGNRRAWDKGAGAIRLGEGPSARSVWQASKDEATLEAIRVAGEDSVVSRTARVPAPKLTAEAMEDDNGAPERDPIWTSWSNAMDALKDGDMDTAYAEVLSTGDDSLLVKVLDRSGPVIDQLSNETAYLVLQAIAQFLPDPTLFDICLSWIQQLIEVVLENGLDVFGLPMDLKKELLLNLHEASDTIELPEDWEGVAPDDLLLQLASAWGIEVQKFDK